MFSVSHLNCNDGSYFTYFLVLYFLFDVLDGIGRLDVKGDRLPCKSLYKYLHSFLVYLVEWCVFMISMLSLYTT